MVRKLHRGLGPFVVEAHTSSKSASRSGKFVDHLLLFSLVQAPRSPLSAQTNHQHIFMQQNE